MEKWVVTAKKADFQGIGRKYGIDPVIARIIRNRDITGDEAIEEYLNGTLADIPSWKLLKDIDKAVEIISGKIDAGTKMRIIGDYDIDGVTATYILLKGFKRLGANVDTYIPDRVADGYGIHDHLIKKAMEDGIDTIVTCDNGISASSQITYAKELGMTVVVTDHHEVPFTDTEEGRTYILPPADAIINPKQADCTYPNKNICGAVVAMKLVFALYEKYRLPEEEKEDFLEPAAIATVGDIMDLQGENRILVKEGLARLPFTKNKGLKALIRAIGLEDQKITSYDIGFRLGPCINASGRLDTAMRSLALLQSEDEEEAAKLAGDLKALNDSRKALTEKETEEAYKLIESSDLKNDRVMVVFLPECHESLAGIIAGRIREKYHKPTFVLTRGEKSLKGSGRSTENYSMYEELVKCDSLLVQYGGHPMAAGLSIEEENVEKFRQTLNDNCTLTEEDMIPKIVIDVPMPISYINEELVEQLSILEPFGKGNTKPLFAQKNLRVLKVGIYGKTQNTVKLQLRDPSGAVMDGLYWGEAKEFADFARSHETISVTYYPRINSYMGRESLQIVIQNYC
ncbi:Single-stranded-DNA-specific exonuclease recJ [uncultured Blautia sp.]|uniref:single-stranded-DNA-specific exonuclease RecJ n=1 Tax=Blautia TaxID=572511 RepID=UPI000821D165|nr:MULTISPECIES: single-stranded-DNA-specific exonuclease RecJ [Blautia]MCU6774238.1 single-stranded-DNA-specific exonuclease RecJ [Blautia acetigignens]NSL02766.1 single-stranded-DNA-specific exonuclease RecJ [Blautia glucerasea]SCH34237.1 Single-stranded-DNA-specific exonuclease recJ [uncultured Blautia sp.]